MYILVVDEHGISPFIRGLVDEHLRGVGLGLGLL